jgi:hypothetical protein
MCFFYYLSVFMFIRGHPEEVTQKRSPRRGHPEEVTQKRSPRRGHPEEVTQKGSPRRGHPETKMFEWVWYAGSHAF